MIEVDVRYQNMPQVVRILAERTDSVDQRVEHCSRAGIDDRKAVARLEHVASQHARNAAKVQIDHAGVFGEPTRVYRRHRHLHSGGLSGIIGHEPTGSSPRPARRDGAR
jgi:hypothetical protein